MPLHRFNALALALAAQALIAPAAAQTTGKPPQNEPATSPVWDSFLGIRRETGYERSERIQRGLGASLALRFAFTDYPADHAFNGQTVLPTFTGAQRDF